MIGLVLSVMAAASGGSLDAEGIGRPPSGLSGAQARLMARRAALRAYGALPQGRSRLETVVDAVAVLGGVAVFGMGASLLQTVFLTRSHPLL